MPGPSSALSPALAPYAYPWPRPAEGAAEGVEGVPCPPWRPAGVPGLLRRDLPESAAELAADSRWPALFPAPLCLVTAAADGVVALEKVVGASIVNRFPYTLALSFCVTPLSARHHARNRFLEILEAGGTATVQFLPPGPLLDRVLRAILEVPEERTHERLAASGLKTRPAAGGGAPVLEDAVLAYEARLVKPGRDFFGEPIFPAPAHTVGSHRIVFLEIERIQLDAAVAEGRRRIHWRSLPAWTPRRAPFDAGPGDPEARRAVLGGLGYTKGYAARYVFPASSTVRFEADEWADGMAVKHLPPTPEAQVEIDNDRARWPCFFPSSLGMITSWERDGRPNAMPCGSTTVVSRHPLVIAPCISYSPINARYAPRASLDRILETGRFGCGVPFVADGLQEAIGYLGNVSIRRDPDKVANAGLTVLPAGETPVLAELPVHYDCRVTGHLKLGTHVMIFGEVERIFLRDDAVAGNPLSWCPWADVLPAG